MGAGKASGHYMGPVLARFLGVSRDDSDYWNRSWVCDGCLLMRKNSAMASFLARIPRTKEKIVSTDDFYKILKIKPFSAKFIFFAHHGSWDQYEFNYLVSPNPFPNRQNDEDNRLNRAVLEYRMKGKTYRVSYEQRRFLTIKKFYPKAIHGVFHSYFRSLIASEIDLMGVRITDAVLAPGIELEYGLETDSV
jgi:hypothetical protein